MIINGGTGNGFAAKVNKDNQLVTMASTVDEVGYYSYAHQETYNINSYLTNIASGSAILFFRNTDPYKNFHLGFLRLGSSIAAQFDVYKNSTYVVNTGTTITPGNLNYTSGKVALMTALGNGAVTTLTPGIQIARFFVPAYETIIIPLLSAVILGLNNDVTVYVTHANATNSMVVTYQGYYKETLMDI